MIVSFSNQDSNVVIVLRRKPPGWGFEYSSCLCLWDLFHPTGATRPYVPGMSSIEANQVTVKVDEIKY